MIVVRRPIRFEEVDAAGIVFFAHYAAYAHEAMERLFDACAGGYVALITKRKIGFPAVTLAIDFHAPLRYGDTARIHARVARIGTRSVELAYRVDRDGDALRCATISHITVVTNLTTMTSCDMPADVRAALTAHRGAFTMT